MITIFTDGAAKGNPGPGGYGVVMKYNQHRKELSSGFRLTTNNRMELLAVIRALQELKVRDIPVTIYSDSKYVVDAIEKVGYGVGKKKDSRTKRTLISGKFIFHCMSGTSLSSCG
jgi:ribonuclease HI